jgi:hypothetical protein
VGLRFYEAKPIVEIERKEKTAIKIQAEDV